MRFPHGTHCALPLDTCTCGGPDDHVLNSEELEQRRRADVRHRELVGDEYHPEYIPPAPLPDPDGYWQSLRDKIREDSP